MKTEEVCLKIVRCQRTIYRKMNSTISLMGKIYQKSIVTQFRTYTLGYPNEEVRIGFIESLIPAYLYQPTRESNFYVTQQTIAR